MPLLSEAPPREIPKRLLLLGKSGSGKTGALLALAKAGYTIHIADFDDQAAEVLEGVLATELEAGKITRAEWDSARAHIDIEVFTDKKTIMGEKRHIIAARAWPNFMKQLSKWAKAATTNDVIVIDDLTFASEAAANSYLDLAKRLNKVEGPDPYTDYNAIQTKIKSVLDLLCSSAVPAHVIVNAHVDYIEIRRDFGNKDEKGKPKLEVVDTEAYPKTIGKALGPNIPTYFNSCLVAEECGPKGFTKRVIHTAPVGLISTKSPYGGLPKQLPIETGLATFFAKSLIQDGGVKAS